MINEKIIIFDFEVFKNDTLLGTARMKDGGSLEYYQTWDLNEIKDFYNSHTSSLWVGHNNEFYDNIILQAILNDNNVYETSESLVENEGKRSPKLDIDLNYLDLMKMIDEMYSLKMTEAAFGNDISETEVDFDLDRSLTKEEKLLTESYNRDDLNQTYNNFLKLQSDIQTRVDLLSEFNLPIKCINYTKGRLGAICLGAKKIWGIEKMKVDPILYPDLRLNNQELMEYYKNEKYLTTERIDIDICGGHIRGGSGGMHAAQPKYHAEKGLYFDVSGFYNLIMINKGLLPRGLGEEGKKTYERLYHLQLELKKKDPRKRAVYKLILLAVFGAQMNKYSDFYDPYHGNLIMITGQLYLIDLLEKLENKVELIQANTDGIIVKVLDNSSRDEVVSIVEEWEGRTGFTIKKVDITDIWQRDVNCYMYRQDGVLHVVGENAVYENWEDVFSRKTWKCKEPIIIAYCVVDFLMNGVLPEDTVKKYKDKYRMFQYIAKKGSYKSMESIRTYSNGEEEIIPRQKVNRVFASNSKEYREMIYKTKVYTKATKKNKIGDISRSKVGSLPDNIFVYNEDINNPKDNLEEMIDYDWYVLRGYEKICTFLPGMGDEKDEDDDE